MTPLSRAGLVVIILILPLVQVAYGAREPGISQSRSIPDVPLTASFSLSPSNPGVGQVVTFTSSAAGGTSPYTFSWNFGDGGKASGQTVNHIFISLQTFTVTLTVTDSVGGTNSAQNSVFIGSLNSRVNCTPAIVRITDITANATGMTSFNKSPWSPGITTTVVGGVAKRWLTPGPTPSGWHSPGPSCSFLVEIDGVKRPSTSSEDSSSSYDPTNGGGSYGGGSFNDFTFNAFDPAVVPNYGNSCTSASDPTCYGRIHMEMDHDWQAAHYCGPGTSCDPGAFSSGTTDGVTLIDFQGFVFWDGPSCCSAQDHSFSGWELHPLTSWRVHRNPLTVGISYSPSSPSPSQTVTFTGTATGGTSPYTFTWDFGDGTTVNGNPATHSYSAAGSYNVHLSVTDANGARGVVSSTIAVTNSAADFSDSSSPSSLTIQSGSQGTSIINLSSLNGFSGTIALSASVLPSGLTVSLNPSSVGLSTGGSGFSTLTASSATVGTYTVTVTGTSGSLSHSTTVTVTVVAAPDFSISSNPVSLWLPSGSSAASSIQLLSLNSFSGIVTLSAGVSSPGLTATLNTTSVSLLSGGSGSSTLNLASSTPGNYTITVTGTSGSLSHSAKVKVTGVSSLVVSDATLGPTSMFPPGGTRIIQDSAGKMIAVYVDNSGRIGLSYDNTNPMLATWSIPVKSGAPTSQYAWPAAVLTSLASLRIIAVGGSAAGALTDISVTITRDSQNNITGFTFGTLTTLDSSGLNRYPAAVLAHNGDILLAWAWENSTRSLVKSLRWDSASGWTNFVGSSTNPDIVFLDSSSIQWFVPSLIERPDSYNGYIMANRFTGPPATVAFNKASWDGSGWSWGAQNLTYETNASDADDDPVGLAWDPTRSLIVASYGKTGTLAYGVFTLNALDQKTHNDTPSLPVTGDRGWASIAVHTTTGDYYLFYMSVNTDAGSGALGYIRLPTEGFWNATVNWLDTATDNQVLSVRPTGTGSTLDLLYAEGTSAPVKLKFIRLSPANPPSFTVAASPGSLEFQAGSSANSTITLTSVYNFTGTITLSATVSPAGPSASPSPVTVTLTNGGVAGSTLTMNSSTSGAFTVTIMASSGSLSRVIIVVVTVTDAPPTVTFTPSTSSVFRDQPVTLTISVSDSDGTVTSVRVNWGDGTIDSLAGTATTDSHSYVKSGTFTINITATDNGGMTGIATASVSVTDAPPTISFVATPTTTSSGQTITLSISSSDPDGTITQTLVNWGDGVIHTLTGAATTDSHAYTNTGNLKTQTFTVSVTVTDNATLTVTNTALVTISDLSPTASFTSSPLSSLTEDSIIFNATASHDSDGSITSYFWNFGDGSTGTGTVVSHSYANTGNSTSQAFTVTLTITDNSDNTAITQSIETITDRPPSASFTESTLSTTTGTEMTFDATASTDPDGMVTNYSWTFGDGGTASGPSVSHSYSNTGNTKTATFTITLTVTDNSGNLGTYLVIETIADRPPNAGFTRTPSSNLTGDNFSFNATASADPDGAITSYYWSFGDGSTGVGAVTSHSYASTAGGQTMTFTVTLTVTDNAGNIGNTTAFVIVMDRPPSARIDASPSSAYTGTGVTFNATASNDVDGSIAAYSWTLGDSNNGTGKVTTHDYAAAGAYTVTLTVTDDSGNYDSATFTIVILDRPPVPVLSSSSSTSLTLDNVDFTSVGSLDPDGSIVAIAWNFGDGSTASGPVSSHIFTLPGTYVVSLNVTDNSGNGAAATMVITIQDRPPVGAFTFGPSSPVQGQPVSFDASSSSDPDGVVTRFSWSFGDGSPANVGSSAGHTYTLDGNYTVTLTVTDDNGSIGTAMTVVTVGRDTSAPTWGPSSSLTINQVSCICSGTSLTLSWTGATDDGGIISYEIYVNGVLSTTVAGNVAFYTFSSLGPGSYVFRVEAVDYGGLSSTNGPIITATIGWGGGSRYAT